MCFASQVLPLTLYSGATKGIGRAITLDLGTRGASILGTFSSPQSAHNFDVLSHNILSLHQPAGADAHALAPAEAPKLQGVAADITSLPSIDTSMQLQDKKSIRLGARTS